MNSHKIRRKIFLVIIAKRNWEEPHEAVELGTLFFEQSNSKKKYRYLAKIWYKLYITYEAKKTRKKISLCGVNHCTGFEEIMHVDINCRFLIKIRSVGAESNDFKYLEKWMLEGELNHEPLDQEVVSEHRKMYL